MKDKKTKPKASRAGQNIATERKGKTAKRPLVYMNDTAAEWIVGKIKD